MSFAELSSLHIKLIAEILSATLSIISIALLARGNGRGWPVGVAAAVLFGWVFWLENIKGQAALNLYFLIAQLIGWRRWATSSEPDIRHQARRLDPKHLTLALLAWLLATPLLARVLDLSQSLHVGLDAFATVGSLLGQALIVAGFAECWLVYLVADLVLVVLAAKAKLWAYLAMYLLYCGLAWQGWREWTRDGREERRNDVRERD